MLYLIPIGTLLTILFVSLMYNKKKKTVSKDKVIVSLDWHRLLIKHVFFYQKLNIDEQKVFRTKIASFLNEINIEAVHFDLEELDRLLIAASAIIPVFRFPNWKYANLSTVLIYPDYFDEDLQFDSRVKGRTIGGLVGTGRFEKQMILSRKALYLGFINKTDKSNTAVHEFIHLLDKADGVIDGIPSVLLDKQYIIPWLQLVHIEMEAINNDTSDIRNYGGTSEIEFLAVAGEYLFERPKLFQRKHPELYNMLAICFSK